ncbi:hypothetical protein Pfo_019558 [Paulownia fortunei]|nr:hypothetical protein Pfo_019558 [Paulownia fortunei]
MDYTRWAEMQQNPNPNPNSDPFSPSLYTSNYPIYYAQNINCDPYKPLHYTGIDPYNAFSLPQPRPPGLELPYVPPPETVTVVYAQHPVSFEPQQGADAVVTSYYPGPSAGWAAAIRQLGASANAAGVTLPNPAIRSQRSNTRTKRPQKTKVVQSAWCEVCKIDCNSKDVLDQHKLGKKHKKNLEKLIGAIAPIPAPAIVAASIALPTSASAPIDKPIIGPQQNPDKSEASSTQKTRMKAATHTQDLETKRRKVLEGGAAADAVRACIICNVVCNSDTVFNYHLAGKKHAAMIKKQASRAEVASAI